MKALYLAIAMFTPVAAHAEMSFCDQMLALMEPGDEQALTVPSPATCTTSQALTGRQDRNCYWVFPYRSAAAQTTFAALLESVTACLGTYITVTSDQSVNHPDAYDLRLLESNGAQVAVSLKDKGALQQTFVFLRVPVRR